MAGLFDDLIPVAPSQQDAPPLTVTPGQSTAPQAAAGIPAAFSPVPQSGLFDDLIPPAAAVAPDVAAGSGDADAAVGRGLINGVPIVGPYLLGGIERGIVAPLRALSKDESYADALKQTQQFDQATQQQHPIANTAGEVAGGVLSLAPVMAAAPAAFGAGDAPLALRSLAGAGTGAGIGGSDAAVRSGGDLKSAAIGAGAGAALGGAAPAIGAGAGALYRKIAGQAVPAVAGVGTPAQQYLMQSLKADDPAQVMQRIKDYGDPGTLADYGPSLRGIAEGVMKPNSPSSQIIDYAMTQRNAGTNGRLGAVVDQQLGPAQSPLVYQQGLSAQIAPLAQAQQQALANAGPVDVADAYQRLQGALQNAAPGSPEHTALSQAQRMLAPIGAPPASSFEPSPVGAPPAGAPPPDPTLYDDTALTSRPSAPGVPRPQTLQQFVRSAGGIQDKGGDVAAMGLQNLVARPGQGLGADAMRQAAAQAGYLGGDIDHAMAGTDVNDLLNAIGSDQPVHSVFDHDAAATWGDHDALMELYNRGRGDPNRLGLQPQRASGLPFGGPDAIPDLSGAGPTTNAQTIYSARQALDDQINYGGPTLTPPSSALRSQQGAYQGVRRALSDALKQQVPGYGEATDQIAPLAAAQAAVDDGTSALGAGQSAIRPDDFAAQYAAMSPEQQAAYRVGMRHSVDAALGTRANDLQALKTLTQGDNGWNAQKLGTAFGQPAAESLNSAIDREAAFRNTFNKVVEGSKTKWATAAAKALADDEYKPFQFGERPDVTLGGVLYTGAIKPVNALLRAFQPAVDNSGRDIDLARAVTMQGDARNQMLAQLLRAYQVQQANGALAAPVANAATRALAISPTVLSAVLRGHQQPNR